MIWKNQHLEDPRGKREHLVYRGKITGKEDGVDRAEPWARPEKVANCKNS